MEEGLAAAGPAQVTSLLPLRREQAWLEFSMVLIQEIKRTNSLDRTSSYS